MAATSSAGRTNERLGPINIQPARSSIVPRAPQTFRGPASSPPSFRPSPQSVGSPALSSSSRSDASSDTSERADAAALSRSSDSQDSLCPFDADEVRAWQRFTGGQRLSPPSWQCAGSPPRGLQAPGTSPARGRSPTRNPYVRYTRPTPRRDLPSLSVQIDTCNDLVSQVTRALSSSTAQQRTPRPWDAGSASGSSCGSTSGFARQQAAPRQTDRSPCGSVAERTDTTLSVFRQA